MGIIFDTGQILSSNYTHLHSQYYLQKVRKKGTNLEVGEIYDQSMDSWDSSKGWPSDVYTYTQLNKVYRYNDMYILNNYTYIYIYNSRPYYSRP